MEKVLEHYAARGVFRGFSRVGAPAGKAAFRLLWHRDRVFEVVLDTKTRRLTMPVVLPEVPADSTIYSELRAFVQSKQSTDTVEHRRIDPAAVRLRCTNRRSQAGVSVTVMNGDYEYAARKLIHLVQEIYLDFLGDGKYYDYVVETFNLDPDRM